MSTVGAPGGITSPPPAVGSVILAAGAPSMSTVVDPITMASAPQESPIRAAGSPPMSTVGTPGGTMGNGAPCVAVLTIISVTRAAGNMALGICLSIDLHHPALNDGACAALYGHIGA